jgi:predicted permease
MEILLRDARFGLRMVQKRPAFTLSAVMILALGIGVAGAVFNLAMAGLHPRLAVRQPGRLMALFQWGSFEPDAEPYFSSFSLSTYRDYRERLASFSALAAYQTLPLNLAHGDGAERVEGEIVSANYFRALGIDMALGRGFPDVSLTAPDDELAVISHRLWRDALAGDSAALGTTITLNGRTYTVVGVAEGGFDGLELGGSTDVWVPLSTADRLLSYWSPGFASSRGSHWLQLVGRLADGVTPAQAAAEVEALAGALADAYPEGQSGWTARVIPAVEAAIWPGRRGQLTDLTRTLSVIVALILALACANVANMQLGRAAARRGELAVRRALGASEGRIARQLLLESLILVLPAAALALLTATWVGDLLVGFGVSGVLPAGLDVAVDARTILFLSAVAGVVAVAVGTAPALQVSGWKLADALRSGRSEGGRAGGLTGLRRALSVAQIAGSLAVLACGGLLVRSAINLLSLDLGFRAESVALLAVDPASSGYSSARTEEMYRRALEEIEALPNVESAAVAVAVPMSRMRFATNMAVEGAAEDAGRPVTANVVTPGYLATMGIPFLRGRDFVDSEGAPVAILNESAARGFWPGEDALGKRLTVSDFGGGDVTVTIVGIARDARLGRGVAEGIASFIFLPLQRHLSAAALGGLTFHVRTRAGDAAEVVPQVRAAIAAVDPALPTFDARTMREQVRAALAPALTTATYVSILGLLGLLLAAAGIYAVIHNSVVQRTREIGVRMALGAEPGRVIRFVLAGGLRLTFVGTVLGLVAGVLAARLLRGDLHGVTILDPPTFGLAAAVTALVALTAVYVPARRAARVDPLTALRSE